MSKKIQIPKFQIQKVYEDGSATEPELHEISGLDAACRMGRRGFLLTSAIGIGALASLATGCDSEPEVTPDWQRIVLSSTREQGIPSGSALGITAHKGKANSVAFSPDGSLVASGGDDGNVKLWSMRDGTLQKTLTRESAPITTLAFTPDGKLLISRSLRDWLYFWSMPNGVLRDIIQLESSRGYSAPFRISPDGTLLAYKVGKNAVQVLEISTGSTVGKLEHEADVTALAFSPDGTLLATGGNRPGELYLWDIPLFKKRSQQETWVDSNLAFSADGSLLLVAGVSGSLDVLVMPSLALHKSLNLEAHPYLHAMALSSDGKWLAFGCDDFDISIFPISFTGGLTRLRGYGKGPGAKMNTASREARNEYGLNALAFSPNSEYLAGAFSCGSVHIWRMPDDGVEAGFLSALFDPATAKNDISVWQATLANSRAYAGPCGTPLPANAVCTCNCVQGRYSPPAPTPSYSGGSHCTCNKICTCVPIK